jgi:hypothetical protein
MMRNVFWAGAVAGLAIWIGVLYRQLEAARLRGDLYRDAANRLDQRLHESAANAS